MSLLKDWRSLAKLPSRTAVYNGYRLVDGNPLGRSPRAPCWLSGVTGARALSYDWHSRCSLGLVWVYALAGVLMLTHFREVLVLRELVMQVVCLINSTIQVKSRRGVSVLVLQQQQQYFKCQQPPPNKTPTPPYHQHHPPSGGGIPLPQGGSG